MTSARRTPLLIRLACLASSLLWILLLAYDPSLLERFELAALDTELRLAPPPEPAAAIVLVAMDERSVHRYGPLPWPPARVAEVILALERYAPRVIALDLVFTGEREKHGGLRPEQRAGQRPLLEALERSGKVVLRTYFDFEAEQGLAHARPVSDLRVRRIRRVRFLGGSGRTLPAVPTGLAVHTNTPELSVVARAYGHLNLLPSRDGIVRWMPLIARYEDDLYAAFPVEVARVSRGDVPAEIVVGRNRIEELLLGNRRITTDEFGRLLLRFAGRRGSYRTVSVVDVLDARLPAELLRDRIVLVGTTAAGAADVWATPLDPLLPGVEIHATAVDNILRGHFLVRNWFTRLLTFLLLAGLGLAGAWLLPRMRVFGLGRWALLGLAFVGVLVLGHYLVFTRLGYALNVVSPLLATVTLFGGTLVVRYFTEEKQRQQVERSFEHYLDRSVITELLDHPERLQLGGDRRELTVLFCDIRNFTTLAEGIPPETSVEMLNEFFTAMTDVVFATGGLVDKFVGDQIMAVWGAPVERPDHAAAACTAALGMREEFARLRARWAEASPARATMNCGFGINSGPMVVGNIGSNRRFSYTVIGDNVNVASRLEALNKIYGTHILVGPATCEAVRDRFRWREIDQVRVRGRTQTLTVYELLGRSEEPLPEANWLAAFAHGLAAYRTRDWPAAAKAFAVAVAANPADACAEFYLRRAEQFIQNPPAEGWEGVLYLR